MKQILTKTDMKLQKRKPGIYQAYQLIGKVLNDLKETKDNIEKELHHWSQFSSELAKSVGVSQSKPRTPKC